MIIKGFIAFSLLTVAQLPGLSPMSATAFAQDGGNRSKVQYAGKTEGFLLFDVTIAGKSKERTILSIRNENGDELYNETIYGSQAGRRIKIESAEMKQVQFSINSRTASFSKTFSVNTSYVEKTEVVEVR